MLNLIHHYTDVGSAMMALLFVGWALMAIIGYLL
jgi:hypothetical protein